jgi:CDP-diacylglycerol--glycerol-3-phosphate 3-phosphatidyltransferase
MARLIDAEPRSVAILLDTSLSMRVGERFERAKAEALGLTAKGGLMERAERIILVCFGLLFESLLFAVMWVMLVLVAITAVQRFVKVWRQAAVAPVTAEKMAVRRSRRASRRARRDDYRARFQRRRRTQ